MLLAIPLHDLSSERSWTWICYLGDLSTHKIHFLHAVSIQCCCTPHLFTLLIFGHKPLRQCFTSIVGFFLHLNVWSYDITKIILNPAAAVIKAVTVVSYCAPQARMGFLCSALFWAASLHLNSCSSSQIPLTVNDSIKGVTKYRQGPLHHSLLCWNGICLFKAKRPHGQWWDKAGSLSLETNDLKHTSFSCPFRIIEISYTEGSNQSMSELHIFSLDPQMSPAKLFGSTMQWFSKLKLFYIILTRKNSRQVIFSNNIFTSKWHRLKVCARDCMWHCSDPATFVGLFSPYK